MKSRLHIKTKCNQEVDAGGEPVSPTGHYFNSKNMSVCIIAVLEFEVPIDDLCTTPLVRDIFLPINPRFSSIMVFDKKGVRRWKKVEVNLEDHILFPSFPDGLSVESYDNYFDEYLTELGTDPFPEGKPLWQIHFNKYPTSKAAGHLILKLHHALGDGYSLMGALLSCLQRADDPSQPLTFPSTRSSSIKAYSRNAKNVISCVPRTLSAIYNATCDVGWSFMKSTCIADDKTPIRSGNEGIGIHAQAIQITTVELSLDHLKLIRAKLGVTMNAVITGIVSFGARLYMHGNSAGFSKSKSTALVLLNTRNVTGYKSVQEMLKPDTKLWGNQFAFLHVALPELTTYKSSNPLDFILEAHQNITRKKNSPAVFVTGQFLEVLRKLRGPEVAARYIINTLKRSSLAITSVIGPVEKMALANHPVKGLYFMVLGVPQTLTISVTSYMRTVRIGIGAEKAFIDSQKFTSCMENAFQLIYKEATKA